MMAETNLKVELCIADKSEIKKLIADIWAVANAIVWSTSSFGQNSFTHFLNEVNNDRKQAATKIKEASVTTGASPSLCDRAFKRYQIGDDEIEFTKEEFGDLTEIFAELLRWQKDLDGRK